MPTDDIDCVIIGGGQAGLSAGYFLQRFGLGGRFVILDHAPASGGAWQFRWPTLTLAGANHVHDLPGWGLTDALGVECDAWPASSAVADYFGRYEKRFDLPVAGRSTSVRYVATDPITSPSQRCRPTVRARSAPARS